MQRCNRCTRNLEGQMVCTIYSEPKEVICGVCSLVEDMDIYKTKGIITTKISIEAALAESYAEDNYIERLRPETKEFILQNKAKLIEIRSGIKEIEGLVNEFEDKHWLPYLKQYWNDSSNRGHSYDTKNCTVMMWGCAGRVLITAESTCWDITMIFSDYVPTKSDIAKYGNLTQRGGIQGIYAPKKYAVDMMKELIKVRKFKFGPKESVTMAGL